MTESEILTGPQPTAEMTDKEFFLNTLMAGRFEMLNSTQRVILAFSYLVETKHTAGEIGRFFDPPKTAARIIAIRSQAYYLLARRPFKIDTLLLSPRAKKGVLRKFGDISPDDLTQVSDEELIHFNPGFGVRSLQELREKLAAHKPQ